jgi:hypothetical protein
VNHRWNLLRILGDLMRDMPGRDSADQAWRDWHRQQAAAYQQIAAHYRGLAAEAEVQAHRARLEAAGHTQAKAGAACGQPRPDPVWSARDRRMAS